MIKRLTVSEAVRNFADYINRVAYRGEHFTLVRGDRPVAELTPVVSGGRLGDLPGLLASLPQLSDSDACAFGEDLTRASAELAAQQPRDPWAS